MSKAVKNKHVGGSARLAAVLDWCVPVLVLAGLLAAGLVVALPAQSQQAFSELAAGTTSVFQTTADGVPTGLHISVVAGPSLLVGLPGKPTARAISNHWDNYEGDGQPLDAIEYVGWEGSDLLSYGLRFQGTFYPTTPPQAAIDLAPTPGHAWHWQGTAQGQSARSASVFVGYRQVDALGQTLTHCRLYTTTTMWANANSQQSKEVLSVWACPRFGVVRTLDTYGGHVFGEDLVRFSGLGETVAAHGASWAGARAAGIDAGVDQQR